MWLLFRLLLLVSGMEEEVGEETRELVAVFVGLDGEEKASLFNW